MAAQGKQREGARGPAGPAHPTTVWMANAVDWREAVGCRWTERVAADRTAGDQLARPTQRQSAATRKPRLPVELVGSFALRASTRYRLQYDSWQRYEPPRMTRWVPRPGP